MMQQRQVVDAVVRPNYIIRYEQWDSVTLIHVLVRRWTARIAREFQADIDTAHALLGRPVYVVGNSQSPNLPKFLKKHGFVPCGSVYDATGNLAPIFERTLDGRDIWRGRN